MATATKARRKAKARKGARRAPERRAAARKPAKAAAPKKQEWIPPHGFGTFCWQEYLTNDVPGAKAFYTALFGWTTREEKVTAAPTTMWQRGAEGIGCTSTPYPTLSNQWLPYVHVESVDASAARISSLGGTILVSPTDIGPHGRVAVAKDPQGAAFAIYQWPQSKA